MVGDDEDDVVAVLVLCSDPLVCVVDVVVEDAVDALVSADVSLPSILSITVFAFLIISLAMLSLTRGLD